MTGKDMIAMSQEDLKRLVITHKVIGKHITQVEAASILDLSDRQVRRIIRRVVEEGDKGVIHRSRGSPSHNAIELKIKTRIINLCKEVYEGFGPTLASEKLFERDKIQVSRETLRQWLKQANLSYRDRKKRFHRQWRERKEHYGQMIQMDGSEHDWFEGRGPYCVFMGYIDDATGKPFGRFYEYEGTIPAMDSFRRYIKKHGIPLSIYLDKHTTYKSTKKQTIEEELANQEALSQFERAVKELGVNVIHANSPQAKGRIERLFKTFQDRLIKEMRLANICTIDQANIFLGGYLPIYAKRFAVKPSRIDDLHRAIPKGIDLNKVLCIKTDRALRNDFTVVHDKKLYQILDNVMTKKVVVEERINGSMVICHKDTRLKFKEIKQRPVKDEPERRVFVRRRVCIPSENHPWKRWIDRGYPQNPSYQQKEKSSKKEKELLLVH